MRRRGPRKRVRRTAKTGVSWTRSPPRSEWLGWNVPYGRAFGADAGTQPPDEPPRQTGAEPVVRPLSRHVLVAQRGAVPDLPALVRGLERRRGRRSARN